MRKIIILALVLSPLLGLAQGKTMHELSDQYPDAFELMFYHSSLNMLNIEDNEDYARVIKDIDRIKLIRIEKDEFDFASGDLKDIRETLTDRSYEELMMITSKDSKISVFIQEDGDDVEGFFLYMDEEEAFTAIDVRGYIQLNDIGLLVEKLKDIDKI
jgi:molybdopterin converting factor small subunit